MAKKKPATPQYPYDLFGEIPVTWPEIRSWMRRHTRFDPDSFRGRTLHRITTTLSFSYCTTVYTPQASRSDTEIQKYLQGWEPPKIDTLLDALEKTPGFSEKVLSRVKTHNWRAMCGYTHTGGLHVQRWITSDGIEPNYDVTEILEILEFAEGISSMSIIGIAELANDSELAERVLNKVKQRITKRAS